MATWKPRKWHSQKPSHGGRRMALDLKIPYGPPLGRQRAQSWQWGRKNITPSFSGKPGTESWNEECELEWRNANLLSGNESTLALGHFGGGGFKLEAWGKGHVAGNLSGDRNCLKIPLRWRNLPCWFCPCESSLWGYAFFCDFFESSLDNVSILF